jgi:hypothetical protein
VSSGSSLVQLANIKIFIEIFLYILFLALCSRCLWAYYYFSFLQNRCLPPVEWRQMIIPYSKRHDPLDVRLLPQSALPAAANRWLLYCKIKPQKQILKNIEPRLPRSISQTFKWSCLFDKSEVTFLKSTAVCKIKALWETGSWVKRPLLTATKTWQNCLFFTKSRKCVIGLACFKMTHNNCVNNVTRKRTSTLIWKR